MQKHERELRKPNSMPKPLIVRRLKIIQRWQRYSWQYTEHKVRVLEKRWNVCGTVFGSIGVKSIIFAQQNSGTFKTAIKSWNGVAIVHSPVV
jgi:hypothetical protein